MKEISPNTTIPDIKIVFDSFVSNPRIVDTGPGGWGTVMDLEKTMVVKMYNAKRNGPIGHVYRRMQELSNTREIITDVIFDGVDVIDPEKGVVFTGRVLHSEIWMDGPSLYGYIQSPHLIVTVDIIDIGSLDVFNQSGKLDDGNTIHL